MPEQQGFSAQDISDLVKIAAMLPQGDPRAAKISAALKANAAATGAVPSGYREPSAASQYGEALTNPVGSGAHPQNAVGLAEQVGGRALGDIGSMVAHPINAIESIGKSLVPLSGNPDSPGLQLGGQLASQFDKSPALAAANLGGDALAMYAGSRLGQGAVEGVEPSPSLGKLNTILPNAVQKGIIPTAAEAVSSKIPSGVKATIASAVPSLVDGPPDSLLTRAIKPGKNNINWNTDVQKAIPLMKSAEQQIGHPVQGLDDALEAANIAKKNIWQQYQARLGSAGQMGAAIDGNQIADAMVNSVDKRTALQNPGLVAKVKAVADTYRKPMSLDQAEDFLQSANKDLNSYYAKNKVGQRVAQNDPEISSTVAEAGALRNALYEKLDEVSGPGAAQLKQAYGSLTNVEKELYGRQLVAARQNPESLSEQLSTVRGAGKIAKGVLTASPGDVLEGAQNIAVSRALKARNSSDAMISRAFQKAQPATPFPMPASPRFAGLLQRGPIQMGAPESASSPSAPPPFSNTTRAQRLGLLLPDKTGGPIELPYVPEMTADEKLTALLHYLRTHPQRALPSKASAIPLPPGR